MNYERPTVVVGIDAGHENRDECDLFALHLADRLAGVVMVSVNQIREPEVHYAVALAFSLQPSAESLAGIVGDIAVITCDEYLHGDHTGARTAALALWLRAKGRVIRFPGQENLDGLTPVEEITTLSAISHVACVGGAILPSMRLRSTGQLQPAFQAGHLTLLVEWFDENTVVPVTQPLSSYSLTPSA